MGQSILGKNVPVSESDKESGWAVKWDLGVVARDQKR